MGTDWIGQVDFEMDSSHGIVFLTGSDGVRREKTGQIERIDYDAQRGLYQIKFLTSEKTFFYKRENVAFVGNAAAEKSSEDVFKYLKDIAALCDITNDAGENVLARSYEGLTFVHPDSVLSLYLNPGKQTNGNRCAASPIFPFGCNGSQYDAVKTAIENRLSIIQGPPGTGKTQTILNIVSNLVADGRTVLVVSNNNSAIENVREKLSAEECNLGFVIASLGKVENILDFLKRQTADYPSYLRGWIDPSDNSDRRKMISAEFVKMKRLFEVRERAARQRQELSALETEYRHYIDSAGSTSKVPRIRLASLPSKDAMDAMLTVQGDLDRFGRLPLLRKFLLFFRQGVGTWRFWQLRPGPVLRLFKELYYINRMRELKHALHEAEKAAEGFDLGRACAMSVSHLKHVIAKKYLKKVSRRIFEKKDLARDVGDFYDEYPIVLSTTFSARRCLPYFSPGFLFDYVIMDEASQVDVATGALALSCARNAVIVGDKMQLPNVVTATDKVRAQEIFARSGIGTAYDFASHSFLSSIEELFPSAPQTLLREHYRCHPKIINFCNQKFYGGQLVIMTKDNGEDDVINVYRTNAGNHCRGHENQRQVDVIAEEVMPEIFQSGKRDVGIISPYRDQAALIARALPGTQSYTVHKFQGREKEVIVISTTDDRVTPFADDPNLLNVAVSRAKSSLYVVMTGNDLQGHSNIGDLVSYIEYNNFTTTQSRVNSVFDYLYSQYTARRFAYIGRFGRVSVYDSENLMYGLLRSILKDEGLDDHGIIFEEPMKEFLSQWQLSRLTSDERRYALNDLTHIDFLVFNRISKTPVLAIEVDGYRYHPPGTRQSKRDKMKDAILAKSGVPFLRFSTVGSGERAKIISALHVSATA